MQHLTPDISFILPIYKTPEEFLSKCVQSIRDQTHSNIEIILVDDGSPDSCPKLCDSFAKEDNRIKVLHQENAGVGSARNNGVKGAKGKWICFIDPDDWVNITMSEVAIAEVTTYFQTYSVFPDIVMWNYVKEYGKVSSEYKAFSDMRIDFSTREKLRMLQLLTLEVASNVGSIWSKMYRRDFLIRNQLYSDESLPRGQDVELNVRSFQFVHRALYIPNALYHYRYDENTASTAYNENYEDYVKWFIFALYNDVQFMKNDNAFLEKFFERCVHTILSLTVRYTFHKKNPHTYSKKKKQFLDFCSNAIMQDSINSVSYSSFSIARKLALFCLKHKIVFGLYIIANIRQMQYTIKQ